MKLGSIRLVSRIKFLTLKMREILYFCLLYISTAKEEKKNIFTEAFPSMRSYFTHTQTLIHKCVQQFLPGGLSI